MRADDPTPYNCFNPEFVPRPCQLCEEGIPLNRDGKHEWLRESAYGGVNIERCKSGAEPAAIEITASEHTHKEPDGSSWTKSPRSRGRPADD